jgi:hypothetical protein
MTETAANAPASEAAVMSLEQLCSIEDILQRSLSPFMTFLDVSRLECVSKTVHSTLTTSDASIWKMLCQRDYADGGAPIYRRGQVGEVTT